MRLAILIGSARNPRRSGLIAECVYTHAVKHAGFKEVELLDVAKFGFDLNIPSGINGSPDYDDPVTKAWSEKISAADAFIFVMPEYNHGYSAAIKLAIDYLYAEWNHKPLAFVAHGGSGGARSIENILTVLKAVSLVPINKDIRLNHSADLDDSGNIVSAKIPKLINKQLDALLIYAKALRSARPQL